MEDEVREVGKVRSCRASKAKVRSMDFILM